MNYQDALQNRLLQKNLDFSSPDSIAAYYMQDLRNLDREHLILAMLNNKCCLIHDCVISIGTVNTSLVNPREIFTQALRYGAVSIVMLHNHQVVMSHRAEMIFLLHSE